MPMFERKDCLSKKFFTKIAFIPLFTFLFVFPPYSLLAATVNLAWNPSTGSNIAGYKMYYGTSSRNYSYNVNVGNSTSCSLSGLTAGKKYYFAATAYNTSNAESSYSSEISYTAPTSSTSSSSTTTSATLTVDHNTSQTVFAFEAEEGVINNSMVTGGDNKSSSGTYIWAPNGTNGYSQYTFNVTSAGNYIVWGRVLAPDGNSNSFFVSMDGKADSLWDVAQSSSWTWDKVNHRNGADPVVYNLTTGKHTLVIKQRENGAKLDGIVITKDMNTVPNTISTTSSSSSGTTSTSGSNTTTTSSNLTVDHNNSQTVFAFEAEEGVINNSMVTGGDNKSSSGTYIWAPNGNNGYSQYTFQVTSSGKYIIWGRVLAANGNSDSFFVSMDGKADSLWDVAQSSSWTWDKVNHRNGADPVVYNLTTGKHTLVIKQRENGAKLDGIVITKDMNTVPNTISTTSSSSSGTTSTSGSNTTTTSSNLTVDHNSSSTVFAFEAEEGVVNNSMVTGGDSKSSSGTYIWAPNGNDGYSLYTFNVTSAGNYIVWGRVLAPDGYSDSFFVSMDGKADSLWDVARSSSWIWDKANHRGGADPVVYNLNNGTHTLRIKQRENGTKLDGIVITKDLNTIPSAISTTSTSSGSSTTSVATLESVNAEIEAEDGTMSKSMERASDNSASSGMYIWVPEGGGSGGSAKFTFNVSKAGKYIIWGRVLAPDGYSDSFYISMDGKADSLWDVAPSNNWTWDKVNHRSGADPVVYNLSTGEHTLLIKQREDGTKIDEFIITDDLNFKP